MSYTPIVRFKEWLDDYAAATGYSVSRGMWQETGDASGKKFIALWVESGRKPAVGVEYPMIRMIVTGRRDARADVVAVEQFAHDTIEAAIEHHKTNCIADVQPTGSIQGPYYTEANRAWFELNFQLVI